MMTRDNSTQDEVKLVTNHLQVALENALILFVGMFIVGAVVGSCVNLWQRTRLGAILLAVGGMAIAVLQVWMYYTTNGLMHRAGIPWVDRLDD